VVAAAEADIGEVVEVVLRHLKATVAVGEAAEVDIIIHRQLVRLHYILVAVLPLVIHLMQIDQTM
jgi:hypothetical protein